MIEALILSGLLLGGVAVAGALAVVLLLKLVLWTILLPFHLLFLLFAVPLAIVKFILRLLAAVVLLPVAMLGGVLGFGALALAGVLLALVPLLPFAAVGLIVWALVRGMSHRNLPVVS